MSVSELDESHPILILLAPTCAKTAACSIHVTSKRFRSTWMGIIIHSGQSVYFLFLILGLVLGLAYRFR